MTKEAVDLSSWTKLPHRIAVDAKGYVWRAYRDPFYDDQLYWSMAPVNPDNSPVPHPVTFYEPTFAADADAYKVNHETERTVLTPSLASLHTHYLAVRQHTLSTDGLPLPDQIRAEGEYVEGEARELREAAAYLAAEVDVPKHPADAILDAHRHVRHEIADVVLAATTFAKILGVTVEQCIAEKTEADRGRG